MNIKFRYLDYNDNKNILLKTIQDYTDEDILIITDSEISKNMYYFQLNYKKIKIFNNIISMDTLLEKIFFSKSFILKDIKRFLSFYSCLDKEIKEKLNIKNYYDCIEIADDFFEFFKYSDNEEIKNLEFSKWQLEKIEIFNEIKKNFDIFLDENNYIPFDWLFKKENLDLFYLKKYKKIVFYDIVEFPYNFKEILEEINKSLDIEIVIQIAKDDFDEKNLKIKTVSLADRTVEINISDYKNDFELYNILRNSSENLEVFSANINSEDKYSIFTESNKYILNDTKLYKILEVYKNILDEIDHKTKTINLFRLKDYIFKQTFMEFYGLDLEDYKTFEEILVDEYRYISLELLEKDYFKHYLENNINLAEKLKLIFNVIKEIEKIKNIEELNQFLKRNFFSNPENIKYFIEDKYSTIFDKFYEILGILNSNENMEYFKNLSKFFENNLGKNIYTLFFNYLNKITIYTTNELRNKDMNENLYLKDLYTVKLFTFDKNKINLIHTDNKVLPKIKSTNTLFTEQQKSKLKILTNEDLILIEKYRTFQNLYSFSSVNIYSLVDIDNNIDYSSFIYEYINKYSYKENLKDKEFLNNLYIEMEEEYQKNKAKFRPFKKELADFKSGVLKIGAYDYINLLKGETFFFLDKLCHLNSAEEIEETNGISLRMIGIILHKTMEDIFKANRKSILESIENIKIDREEIEKTLKNNLERENLKIEIFLKDYTNEILIKKLEKNIIMFLNFLYRTFKDKEILSIEAEKSNSKEIAFLQKNGVEVFLTGRADLIIETAEERYIIDFKTGNVDKNQLEFYAVMLYGNEKSAISVYSFAYNFWTPTEIDLTKVKVNNLIELKEKIYDSLSEFLEGEFYRLPEKKRLKEDKFDFNKYSNYKYLCPIDKIEGDIK